jgi:hypothetical protein
VRAPGSLPIAGADENFAVALALFAMKLVNRHEGKITGGAKISSAEQRWGETARGPTWEQIPQISARPTKQ